MREAVGVPWTGATPMLEVRDSSRPYVRNQTSPTARAATADARSQHCPSYKLPEYGVIEISPGYTINLTANAIFRPQCTSASQGADGDGTGQVLSVGDIRDPFHASITPQAYATGAATVISWMLVIMLIITPRTFFVGNASGRSGLMGRRGMISGASGGGSIIGVGSRPWLQKVAALTVAISLTLATADTFRIAGRQYAEGFIDAMELRDQVVSGMEIKVSRIISDIFLWLAQVQTLIRLFPRHKEKVIIKWVGFALILLDIIFSALNSFGPYGNNPRPAHFDTAIPALSYLFQLSLSMLYAAWVLYYATTKRRYAFYHSMMWNMSVVALLSIIAILTPVVFFITDIANYTIAGWGDYFRWVGAAAASVIVWEWVERIEALEREERKDGILGREIYDGDDMLDNTPSSSTISKWPYSKRSSSDEKKGGGHGGLGGFSLSAFAAGQTSRVGGLAQKWGRKMTESPRAEARKKRTIHVPAPPPVHRRSESARRADRSSSAYVRVQSPVPPPAVPVVASPVSRTDTTSANSTVYTVRYHPINETPPIRQPGSIEDRLTPEAASTQQPPASQEGAAHPANTEDPEKGAADPETSASNSNSNSRWNWQAMANSFTKKGRAPPRELQRGQVIEPLAVDEVHANIPPRNYNGLAISDRLGTFAAQQGERFRSKKKDKHSEMNLPVTIIPAQPRGQTWSPDFLQHQQQQRQGNGTPQSEVSATAGIQIARIPTTIHEQSDMPSPDHSGHTVNSSELVEPPTSANNNRNAHRRYTPQAGGLTAHPPVSPTSLAEEIQSPTPLLDHASQGSSSQQHTNHDR